MFITEDEFKTVEGMNIALERLYNKSIEQALKFMPDIIAGLTMQDKMVETSLAKFKDAFPELADRQEELALLIQEIELENGALEFDKILELVPARFAILDTSIPTEQVQTPDEVNLSCNGII